MTSVPPSITIDHVQVAKIEKNTMTLSIKISGENTGQKTVETKALLSLEQEKSSSIKTLSKTRKSRQRIWNILLKSLMWMEQMRNNYKIHLAGFDLV